MLGAQRRWSKFQVFAINARTSAVLCGGFRSASIYVPVPRAVRITKTARAPRARLKRGLFEYPFKVLDGKLQHTAGGTAHTGPFGSGIETSSQIKGASPHAA